jgi:hypothetical protein
MRTSLLFLTLVSCLTLIGCASAPKSRYQTTACLKLSREIQGQPDAVFLTSITYLPDSIRRQLSQPGPISDAGGPFSPDCVRSGPRQRFLAATKRGNIYTVAVEHGGDRYYWNITEFVLGQNGNITSTRQFKPDESWQLSVPPNSATNQPPPP